MTLRSRLAVGVGRVVTTTSRTARMGSGSMIGGRVALAIDPHILGTLTAHRTVVLVSATNGKTTTTRMIAAALTNGHDVVSNSLGANMASGHVATLLGADRTATAVLEVDERWLPEVLAATDADVVVLGNLSHDQLDRTHAIRQIAVAWRAALTATPPKHIIANADDPLIAWAVSDLDGVHWVGTNSAHDIVGCPECHVKLTFTADGWHCPNCTLGRPSPDLWLDGDSVLAASPSGDPVPLADLELDLPGTVNRINATMAIAATRTLGIDPGVAAERLRAVGDVAGRYRVTEFRGANLRLLLAKNPAGWRQALAMLERPSRSVIISINARTGDGKDTSWLWDVPFEQLAGRTVVALGERRTDLAVRLRYAGVDHLVADSLSDAVSIIDEPEIDLVANYTAFQSHLEEVSRAR